MKSVNLIFQAARQLGTFRFSGIFTVFSLVENGLVVKSLVPAVYRGTMQALQQKKIPTLPPVQPVGERALLCYS